MDINAIMKRIDELPDKIDPRKDKRFEYTTIWEDGKTIATGLRMKEKPSGYVVKDDDETHEIHIGLSEIAASKQTKSFRLWMWSFIISYDYCFSCYNPYFNILV